MNFRIDFQLYFLITIAFQWSDGVLSLLHLAEIAVMGRELELLHLCEQGLADRTV